MSCKPGFPTLVRTFIAIAMVAIAESRVDAQSSKVDQPAPLKAGINEAAVDSFAGEHFWTFTATPGHFHIVFVRKDPKEGFSVGGKAGIAAVFAPKTPDAVMEFKENPSGTVVDGSVKQA